MFRGPSYQSIPDTSNARSSASGRCSQRKPMTKLQSTLILVIFVQLFLIVALIYNYDGKSGATLPPAQLSHRATHSNHRDTNYGRHHDSADHKELLRELRALRTEFKDHMSTTNVGDKFALDLVTPFQNQAYRGTCWDFATMGMLEHSYRTNGVRNGWLEPEEYLKLSEQAYGIVVMEQCRKQPKKCLIPGDDIWMNTTEGGEIPLLAALDDMDNAILPDSVCPYQTNNSFANDIRCPGLQKALHSNPIKFQIKKMSTLYDIASIKRHLRTHKRALGFSTVVTTVSYFYPCAGAWAGHPDCLADVCPNPCPYTANFEAGSCCVVENHQSYNLDGEFYSHGVTDYDEGGHAMLLVGYNDNFVTQMGNIGGFILKNNWIGPSHSIDYFMQDISRWDESIICPNSVNPRTWYACNDWDDCLSDKARMFAQVSFQPLELKCVSRTGQCDPSQKLVYFIKNYTHTGDDMHRICVFEYDPEQVVATGQNKTAKEICMLPMLLDSVINLFQPIKKLQNSHDRCGFYFFPYDLAREWWSKGFSSFVTDFEIEWDPASYAANEDRSVHSNMQGIQEEKKHDDDNNNDNDNNKKKKKKNNNKNNNPSSFSLDYSHIKASTLRQKEYKFAGPFPYDYLPDLLKGKHSILNGPRPEMPSSVPGPHPH